MVAECPQRIRGSDKCSDLIVAKLRVVLDLPEMTQHVVVHLHGPLCVVRPQQSAEWTSGRREQAPTVGIGWIAMRQLVGGVEGALEKRESFVGSLQADAVRRAEQLTELRQGHDIRPRSSIVTRARRRFQDLRGFTKIVDGCFERSLIAKDRRLGQQQVADVMLQIGIVARDIEATTNK